MSARLVPHRTRVVVRGKAGMVIGLRRGYRRLLGVGGPRVAVPASVIVLLDSGRRVEVLASSVEVEVPVA